MMHIGVGLGLGLLERLLIQHPAQSFITIQSTFLNACIHVSPLDNFPDATVETNLAWYSQHIPKCNQELKIIERMP